MHALHEYVCIMYAIYQLKEGGILLWIMQTMRYDTFLKLFVSTPVIQILPSFLRIGLEGNVEKVMKNINNMYN